jgi:hypothetical protein
VLFVVDYIWDFLSVLTFTLRGPTSPAAPHLLMITSSSLCVISLLTDSLNSQIRKSPLSVNRKTFPTAGHTLCAANDICYRVVGGHNTKLKGNSLWENHKKTNVKCPIVKDGIYQPVITPT